MLNFGEERTVDETIITFAHEVAHNLNAIHDNDIENPECMNKGYIMDEVLNKTAESLGNSRA